LLDTPKGKALAIIFQDYGFDHHNLWTCVVEETGEIWTFQNPEVRARADYTFGVRQAKAEALKCAVGWMGCIPEAGKPCSWHICPRYKL